MNRQPTPQKITEANARQSTATLGCLLRSARTAALAVTALCAGTLSAQTPAEPALLSQTTLDKIAKMKPLFDGKSLEGWLFCTAGKPVSDAKDAWTVKDGAITSLGAGRSVLFTKDEFDDYRVIYSVRHISGQPDHQPCVLIFGVAPQPGEKALDALGSVQFQAPSTYTWDYRPGKNNDGKEFFTRKNKPKINNHDWCQVELLVHHDGRAELALAQPVGAKAVEAVDFNDPTAGRRGPFGLQMHNKGLFDQYKDIRIEEHPKEDKLITVE